MSVPEQLKGMLKGPGHHGGCKCPRSGWRVYARMCNYSAFNGYHFTPSAYSALVCKACAHCWRTKAAYVYATPDLSDAEREAWHRGEFGESRQRLANQKQH